MKLVSVTPGRNISTARSRKLQRLSIVADLEKARKKVKSKFGKDAILEEGGEIDAYVELREDDGTVLAAGHVVERKKGLQIVVGDQWKDESSKLAEAFEKFLTEEQEAEMSTTHVVITQPEKATKPTKVEKPEKFVENPEGPIFCTFEDGKYTMLQKGRRVLQFKSYYGLVSAAQIFAKNMNTQWFPIDDKLVEHLKSGIMQNN